MDQSKTIKLYQDMLLLRRFEEETGRLYMEGDIRGFCHLYIGEEAIAVGSISCLSEKDYIITHYRDHGHALARGINPKNIMSELMGKSDGTSAGKGGSMHIFDVSKRFMGGHAIVGGQLPIACGLGFASKYQEENSIVLCFLGDGAVNEGEFHESMNLASLWKLPILFCLENNLYGMGTHVNKTRSSGKDIYKIADSYKIPSIQVDGMDVLEMQKATQQSIEKIRSGEGPVFLEAMCYRFRGHSMADPSSYRKSQEVVEWQKNDPIIKLEKFLSNQKIIDQQKILKIKESVDSEIFDCIEFAKNSPDPKIESLLENVYQNE
ncbi:MAG: pyruvate dehydrogenase (acetyl-transferring) E1 component subunit alpha [SAR202 cluster bacterium]|nr:pyruvate dehydrogenase (acetyl-transferring) E1 component subunit alpha [SAR202 cluster bacterium]